ncbi:hypothetical protein [Phormidesmis sp. 146-33]
MLSQNFNSEYGQFVLNCALNQSCEGDPLSNSTTSLNASLTSSKLRRTEIAPVPDRLAIAPSRYYLSFSEDGDRWYIPIQLSLFEGWHLLDLVCRERDREAIFKIVQTFVGNAIEGDVA